MTDETRDALESLLRWYAAMGVDDVIDEMPHDRFAAAPLPTRQPDVLPGQVPETRRPTGPPRPIAEAQSASSEALVREAEVRAAAAADIATLRDSFASQPGLTLAASAQMIFAGGTPGARLMLVGAAPDTDEERQGEIFAGAAGRLLDAMLHAVGLGRSGVYLAHVVPWRPPGNRPPTPLELALCLPYTRRHITLAAPDIVLCLGERAAQPLLGSRDAIGKLRGRWLAYEGEATTVKLLATFSPAYLMSQPLQKRRAWADLQMLKTELGAA